MKRFTAFFLAIFFALSCCACTNAQGPAAAPAVQPSAQEAAGGQAAQAGGEPIVVGVYAPLSGDSAMVGATELEGVELAVKQINATGGIDGRPISIVVEDDAQNPATAVSAVNKLVYSDQCTAVIGSVNSSCTLASLEVTQAVGVPHVVPIASNPAITAQGNPWVVRVQASDLLHAAAIVKYAVEELEAKKIALLYQSDDYGATGKAVIEETLKTDYGMELVACEAFEASDSDMSPQLLKAKKADCDVLIMYTMYQQGALIAKQARQMGIECPLMGGGGLTNSKIYDLGGDAVVGLVNTHVFFADPERVSEAAVQFIQDFTEEYGKTPDSNNALAYDSMMILADGLRAASPELKPEDIMAGMHALKDRVSATGTITINEAGDALRDQILMVRLLGPGSYELVEIGKGR